jgi:hypothetical protein
MIANARPKRPETELENLKAAIDLSATHALTALAGNHPEAFIAEFAGHIDSIYGYGTGNDLLELINVRTK